MADSQYTQPLAVLADIHGNSWALDAVLSDIQQRGIRQIVDLGDSVYGSLDPAGTVQRLMDAGIPSLCGNQDHIVYDPPPEVCGTVDHDFVMATLSPAQLHWLRLQPPTRSLGDIFCCHGTPHSDSTYLLEAVTPHGVQLRQTEDIVNLLAGVTQSLILCAHSNVPRTVWLPSGQVVVNPGSVGIPAYDDDLPLPHVMEAGSPHARYAIVQAVAGSWRVEHVALPYPWDVAADVARAHGRPDRATWIATGRVAP